MKRYKITKEFSDWLVHCGAPSTIGIIAPRGTIIGEKVKYLLRVTCDCSVCGGTGIAKSYEGRTVEVCECNTPFEFYLDIPDNKTFEDLFKELGAVEDV